MTQFSLFVFTSSLFAVILWSTWAQNLSKISSTAFHSFHSLLWRQRTRTWTLCESFTIAYQIKIVYLLTWFEFQNFFYILTSRLSLNSLTFFLETKYYYYIRVERWSSNDFNLNFESHTKLCFLSPHHF
jgi:hypothetical protein